MERCRKFWYELPTPKPPLPGGQELSINDFRKVMTRLSETRANVIRRTPAPDNGLMLCRSGSVCGLAQFVFQTLSEYEISLKNMAEDDSRDAVIEAMATERRIKRRTLINSHINPSGSLVRNILHWLSPQPTLPSFFKPANALNPIPWAVIIILIVFLGKIRSLRALGRSDESISQAAEKCLKTT